jgi:hypothetical protein
MDISIEEFLERLANCDCDSDEAERLVRAFQNGDYKVEGFGMEDFD